MLYQCGAYITAQALSSPGQEQKNQKGLFRALKLLARFHLWRGFMPGKRTSRHHKNCKRPTRKNHSFQFNPDPVSSGRQTKKHRLYYQEIWYLGRALTGIEFTAIHLPCHPKATNECWI